MKSLDFLNEGIGEDAHEMHMDHEVQMARQELYHAAEDAIALHKLLRHISEQQGLEGWVSSKITLAADYLKTIREHLEYQMMSGGPVENITTVVGDAMPVAEGRRIAEGQIKKAMEADAERMDLDEFLDKYAHRPEDKQWITEFWQGINGSEEQVNEMSAGSVATVVNPVGKNKAKVGSLFGGTYKQKKTK